MSIEKKFQITISRNQYLRVIVPKNVPKIGSGQQLAVGQEEMQYFSSKIAELENENDLVIVRRTAILYRTTRNGVKFIRIDGYCSACGRSGGCFYKISIDREPKEDSTFIVVDVVQEGNHLHQKIEKIKSQARKCIENDLYKHNGSAKAVRLEMVAKGVENIPSEDAIRQIKSRSQYQFEHEMKKNEGVKIETNTDWYSRLKLVASVLNSQNSCPKLEEKNLQAYVQDAKDFPSFRMILIMKEQIECINSVFEEDRILHFDSTGGLVKINAL